MTACASAPPAHGTDSGRPVGSPRFSVGRRSSTHGPTTSREPSRTLMRPKAEPSSPLLRLRVRVRVGVGVRVRVRVTVRVRVRLRLPVERRAEGAVVHAVLVAVVAAEVVVAAEHRGHAARRLLGADRLVRVRVGVGVKVRVRVRR